MVSIKLDVQVEILRFVCPPQPGSG